jgi:hypothetical protein
MSSPIRERDIEAKAKRYARSKGDYVRKFVSVANRSVPDNVLITAGQVWFAEFKAPGKKLTPLQEEEHRLITEAGALVLTFDNVEDFIETRNLIAASQG